MASPRISVIVVSDYADERGEWAGERRMLEALRAQDIGEPVEIVLASREDSKPSFPPSLTEIAPRCRAIFLPYTSSSQLKDAALPFTTGSLVAVFEADAPPQPNWLRLLTDALDRDETASAISGRTIYGHDTAIKRVAGLLDRGYLERKGFGPIGFVCNNGALYRREFLAAHPYGDEPNPFISGRMRSLRMAEAGKLLFHPEAIAVHHFGGLPFFREVRRNQGFNEGRWAYLERGGRFPAGRLPLQLYLSIIKLKCDILTSWMAARGFIYPYDWPLLAGMMLVCRIAEWRGMTAGLSGRPNLPATRYR
jgi:hypothetical protein